MTAFDILVALKVLVNHHKDSVCLVPFYRPVVFITLSFSERSLPAIPDYSFKECAVLHSFLPCLIVCGKTARTFIKLQTFILFIKLKCDWK